MKRGIICSAKNYPKQTRIHYFRDERSSDVMSARVYKTQKEVNRYMKIFPEGF